MKQRLELVKIYSTEDPEFRAMALVAAVTFALLLLFFGWVAWFHHSL